MRPLLISFALVSLASIATAADDRPTTDPAGRCEASQSAATTLPAGRHAASTKPTPDDVLVAPVTEVPTKSLVARQGLLVPAAFLAAASALSGLLVYAIKPRSATAPADHAEP